MTSFSLMISRTFHRTRGSVLWQCLLAIVLLVALIAYWVGLQHDHQRKIADLHHQTQLRSAQLAKTLAVQAQTLFASLDFVAQNLAAEYAQNDVSGFEAAVRTAVSTHPVGSILQIAVADKNGRIVYSNLESPSTRKSQASIADRDHFLVHAQSLDSGLFISRPLMGRVSKVWTIQISRAMRHHSAFDGVVVVSVAPSYLSSFFREILEQPTDVVMLLRNDGAYMARSRIEEQVLGKSVPKEREFLTQPHLSSGFYDAVAPVDGIDRHYAWHRVGQFPLVLSIGLDKEAVWSGLREEIRKSEMRNAIGSILLLIAASVIAWLSFQGRKARAQVVRSQTLLRNLVNQVPGALFQLRVQANGNVVLPYASPNLYKMHQVQAAPDDQDPAQLLEKIRTKDKHAILAQLRNAATQQTDWQGGYQIASADGSTQWMRYSVKPEPLADGSVLLHGYVQDITQEHAMQQALRNSEQHLRLTMDAVNDGLWQWSIESNEIHWDARCWEMLGYPAQPGVIARETLLEWMHPNDRERFDRAIKAHLLRNEHYHCEFRMRTQQGKWVWIEARGNVSELSDGKAVRMLGTHTDITERVAQAQLRRVLLDESAAAIVLASPDRVIVQANRRAKSMFAIGDEMLAGQSLHTLHHSEESFDVFGQCYSVLRQHGYARQEWMLQMSDGSTRWCDIHGTLLDPQEPNGQVIWTIIDVDDRHRTQRELHLAQLRLTAIIERFPGGVMVQEHLNGPIVAINQELREILEMPQSDAKFSPELAARVAAVLPQEMMLAPYFSSSDPQAGSLSAERVLDDGRTFEIHRIPLWHEERSLGLFWLLRDISQTKQRELVLEHMALTDALTALPNRRAFLTKLQQEFHALRSGSSTSGVLLMLDIDFFKSINDSWGHAVGDEVLKHLSTLLRQSLRLRNGDIAGRLGGEEFAILLPATDLRGGVQMAERLRELIGSTPASTEHGPISFTASMGICIFDASLTSIDQGLERADAALYYAKRSGRNQVFTWNPTMVLTPPPASH